MSRMSALLSGCLLVICCILPMSAQQPPASANHSNVVVPPLVNFSGVLTDANGKPLTHLTGVTFLLYKEEQGGAPLWMETQNVVPDKNGHYAVMLGSTSSTGLPADIFVAGEARWLAVQPQGQAEQPRVMLLSVPYALKAVDAQTIGGLPPSAFVLAAPPISSANTTTPTTGAQPLATGTTPVTTAGGTVNKLAKFDATADITNSQIFDNGTNVGIGNTAPAAKLDVTGGATVRGLLFLPTQGTATATTAYNSQPIKLTSSVFNGGTGTAVAQNFQWQAQPTGNNTATVSGMLNLLFASGTSAPVALGFYISNTGGLHSTYVGVRNNRSATASNTAILSPGIDLTGSIWDGSKNVDRTFRWQVDPGSATTAGKLNLMFGSGGTFSNTGLNISSSGAITFVPGQTFPGTGTITGITTATGSGLTGGGTSGALNLGVDTTKVPLLAANNTFTGNQTVNGNLSATGLVTGSAFNIGSNPFGFGSYAKQNTFLGFAGNSAVSVVGQGNTGVGSHALFSNVGDSAGDGWYNTSVGAGALQSNNDTSGVGGFAVANTAVGWWALEANTTGGSNTASGAVALRGNTTGSNNTANGGWALASNSTGSYNTASGTSALFNNDKGLYNTAVGHQALYSNGAGGGNTAVGFDALESNNTGSNNTALGYGADVITYNLSNATAIGAYAYVAQSNALVLGSISGVNGCRSPCTNTNVGIGTTAPDNTLTVNGTADKPGGGSWGTYSDRRLKTVEGNFNSGLSQILKLRPVRYHYSEGNAMGIRDTEQHVGLVAQQVQAVIPEAVTENSKGYLLVNNDPILWSMLNAIKEQQALIHEQQAQIARLTRQVKTIQATLKASGPSASPVRTVKAEGTIDRQ